MTAQNGYVSLSTPQVRPESLICMPVGVNDLWADFKRAFVMVADRHAHVRGVDNCPWLNRSIKVNMRQRDYFLQKARTTNHSEDWARY